MRLPIGLLASTIACTCLAKPVTLESPLGGWNNSKGDKSGFSQSVNYPVSSVNTAEDQPTSALIRGRIEKNPKDKKPATLIVNGVAMPQRVEEDGRFSRPYSFGAGSNGVEVRTAKGRARTQFYDANPGKAGAKLRVVLSWDTDMTDLDLHVVTPDGGHCYYGNRQLDNGGALDVDVTTGYGPEIFATPNPQPGTYLVYVNYYGAGERNDMTVARITLITHENTPDEKRESIDVPMRKSGELTLVRRFSYP